MGIVYRAEDIWLGRDVALKVIDPAYHGDELTKERFLKEAQALAKVRHDNVVQVYSFGASGGNLFSNAISPKERCSISIARSRSRARSRKASAPCTSRSSFTAT